MGFSYGLNDKKTFMCHCYRLIGLNRFVASVWKRRVSLYLCGRWRAEFKRAKHVRRSVLKRSDCFFAHYKVFLTIACFIQDIASREGSPHRHR